MYFTCSTLHNDLKISVESGSTGWGVVQGGSSCAPAWPEVPLDTYPTLDVTMEASVSEASVVEWVNCVQADVSL